MSEEGQQTAAVADPEKRLRCGIVMPISAIDGLPEQHWLNVRRILEEAIGLVDAPGFDVRMVSEGDESVLIQKRIVQNLFDSDIVVCDVSGKNPNVMLELGMRLAFDKPVVVVKDDQTNYTFDIQGVEHLGYPRTLHHPTIEQFIPSLATKISAIYSASLKPDYSSYLKQFRDVKVASLTGVTQPFDQAVVDALQSIRDEVAELRTVHSTRPTESPENYNVALVKALKRFGTQDPYKTILTNGLREFPSAPPVENAGQLDPTDTAIQRARRSAKP